MKLMTYCKCTIVVVLSEDGTADADADHEEMFDDFGDIIVRARRASVADARVNYKYVHGQI